MAGLVKREVNMAGLAKLFFCMFMDVTDFGKLFLAGNGG